MTSFICLPARGQHAHLNSDVWHIEYQQSWQFLVDIGKNMYMCCPNLWTLLSVFCVCANFFFFFFSEETFCTSFFIFLSKSRLFLFLFEWVFPLPGCLGVAVTRSCVMTDEVRREGGREWHRFLVLRQIVVRMTVHALNSNKIRPWRLPLPSVMNMFLGTIIITQNTAVVAVEMQWMKFLLNWSVKSLHFLSPAYLYLIETDKQFTKIVGNDFHLCMWKAVWAERLGLPGAQ